MGFDPLLIQSLKLSLNQDNGHVVIRSSRATGAARPDYSFGIEEEYFLADARTLEVVQTTPDELFEAINWSTGGQATREMLQSQLEVATNVHVDIKDAREELKFLRTEAAKVAAQFGLAIMAAGTHPTALWRQSRLSPKPRYEEMIEDLKLTGQRNMLCGMHVHVQLPDPARRYPVMCAMIPYLPLFIALATSSPFWNARSTGLKGYRLAAYDELPRTGLPELFRSEAEYQAYVTALTSSGAMPDESYIWWAMRPSMRHPTLELRAPDSCTDLEDAVAIAALYRTLARHFDRKPDCGAEVSTLERAIAIENKWRAQRYGVDCMFSTVGGPVAVKDMLDELLERIAGDAEALHCTAEIARCRTIVETGTSADRQIAAYENANGSLTAVKEWIADTTRGVRLRHAPAMPALG